MKAIGLDIGTTSISAIVTDADSGAVIETANVKNDAGLPGRESWESAQDPARILELCRGLLDGFLRKYDGIGAVGMDGQMHGMLYLDEKGDAVSPLFTWQDGRGNLPYGSATYAEELSRLTGYPMKSGFGLTTHYWHTVNRAVPDRAKTLCSIMDYVALRLCGEKTPVMHLSDAASFGAVDPRTGDWDTAALERAGIGAELLPRVVSGAVQIGSVGGGIPLFCAIGDNQASFIGSVRDPESSVLVNMGTGGQISMLQAADAAAEDIESRPLNGAQRIQVGSVLCGGRSYAILEKFIRGCAELSGYEGGSLYEMMNREGLRAIEEEPALRFDTRFCGTRSAPSLRGAITGIGEDNFTVGNLIAACLFGMAEEEYGLYEQMLAAGGRQALQLIGSGNAIRRCPALKRAFEKVFSMPMLVPAHHEEAAYGACLFALAGAGRFGSLTEAQRLIAYEGEN